MTGLRVYVGYDAREQAAFDVCVASIKATTPGAVIIPLVKSKLEAQELAWRPWRVHRGSIWDVISEAPQSTEFANTRFLVPLLAHSGLALFMDCDMVVFGNLNELVELADPSKAVMCVQHQHAGEEGEKMDGCEQTRYACKNWSSVMLFNCDHPANEKLTLNMVNSVPGRDLHRFCWLQDDQIGELGREWNWLVNVQPAPAGVRIAHFTLGGPWLPDWTPAQHDELWLAERDRYLQ